MKKIEAEKGETVKVTFLKDAGGWYADVQGHTRGQNSMVAGADKFLDAIADRCGFAKGPCDRIIAHMSTAKPKDDGYMWRLKRLLHDPFGATYMAIKKGSHIGPVLWICNVTHDVFKEDHPKRIYITGLVASHC